MKKLVNALVLALLGWSMLALSPASADLYPNGLARVSQQLRNYRPASVTKLATLPTTSAGTPWAYGLNAIITNYSGPTVRVQRVSDSAQTDIGSTSTGAFDKASAIAFQGSSQLRCVTLYEQGGSGQNITAPAATAPVLWLGDGVPACIDGLSWSVQGMVLPSGVVVDQANMSVFEVAKTVSLRNANTSGPFQFGDITASAAALGARVWATTHYAFQPIVAGAYPNPTGADNFANVQVSNLSIMGLVSSGTALTSHRDEQLLAFAPLSSSSLTAGQIMRVSGQAGGQFDVTGLVIYPAALGSSDTTAVKTALQSNFTTVSWSPSLYLHFQGDSRYKGDGVVNDRTVPAVMSELYGNSTLVRNFGRDGDVFPSATYFTTSEGRIAQTGIASSVLFTMYGHNNVKASNNDLPTLIAFAKAYYTNARAAGYFTKIIGLTELPDKNLTTAQITVLQGFDAWMRSDPLDANGLRIFDAIVDLGWDPTLGGTATYTNAQGMALTANSADGIHPSEAAIKAVIAPAHVAALQFAGIMPPSGTLSVAAPVSASVPTISGTAQVGQTLAVTSGLWQTGPPNGSSYVLPNRYRYQWLRDGAAISGATASSYVPVSADIGHVLSATATASNYGGSASSTSAATSAVLDAASALAINSSGVPTSATSGAAFAGGTLTATGGSSPYTFGFGPGSPPAGMVISSGGAVSGTITAAAGTYNFAYRVTDNVGGTADSSVTFTVNAAGQPLAISGTPTTTGTVSTAITSWTATASGGSTPYTYSDVNAALPPGVTINASTGVVSGTPTNAGTYNNIIIQVADQLGATARLATYSMSIAANTSSLILDKLSSPALASIQSAKSVRQLRSAYSGNALDVLVGSTTTPIGFTGGSLNTSALSTAAGSSSATVTQWYEQSLSGTGSATQTTAAPRIVASGTIDTRNSKPSLLFATGKEIDDPASDSGTARTLVFVTSHDTTVNSILAAPSATGGLTARWSSTHQLQLIKTATVLGTSTKTGTLNALSVVVLTFDGTNYQMFVDGQAVDSGTTTATTFTAALTTIIGQAGTTHISEYLLFNSVLSGADIGVIQADEKSYFGTP